MPSDTPIIAMPGQVFQRDSRGVAAIPVGSDRPVEARVLRGKAEVTPWATVRGSVAGIPTGGPYTLEVRAEDSKVRRVSRLLVGDLWVLAGQSNMEGCGKLIDLESPSPVVHSYTYEERWEIARDPLHHLIDSIDPVHWVLPEGGDLEAARAWDRRFREYGGGIGVRFGKEIAKATGVPVGLIPCAHGGTSIEQWDPALRDKGGESLYGSMCRRVRACGGRVTGVLWYQGESNADPGTAPLYKERMRAFIGAVRDDFRSKSLPFIQVQLSRFFADATPEYSALWNHIQQVQLDLAAEVKNTAIVAAIDATLSDMIHIDTASARRTGARMAELALVLAYGKKAPLHLVQDRVRLDRDGRSIRVRYKNIRGRLAPARGVRGFSVEDAGQPVAIVDSLVENDEVVIRMERPVAKGAQLWHGRGLNPSTSLHDRLFAAPVFGPVTL
jgi:sialate O-acetylesterase